MRDAGDVCLDEVWEDGMLSVSAWLGPCSQSISTSCSSANRFAATRGDMGWGGGGVSGGWVYLLTCLGEEDHLLGYHAGPRSQHTRRSASAPCP